MHWPDGACYGRAGDCVRLIGIKVRASGANPPAPYDGCTCCHQNPSLRITWTTTGPAIQRRAGKPGNRARRGLSHLRSLSAKPDDSDPLTQRASLLEKVVAVILFDAPQP